MKAIYKIVFCLLLGICCIACNDDNDSIHGEPLILKASNDTILLNEELADEPAITFTWNKGIDRGSENTIVYIFRLDVFGADFETSTDPIEVAADGEFAISYTNKELNNLITKKWGILPGDRIKLQARVVAKVNGPKFIYPEISVIEIETKSYIIAPKPLYMVGDATAAGSDLNKGVKITEGDIGVFYHWKGNLKAGSFKFISNLGSMLPSLNKGIDNSSLVERTNINEPDNMFTIDKAGYYAIALFREDMKITYTFVPYQAAFLIGNATTAEWELGNAIEFVWNPTTPNVFTLETELKDGEFKILTERNWGAATFRPMVENGSLKEKEVQVYLGDPDLKWKVNPNQAGKYRIILDVNKMEITFNKL
ncbi:SusF/SusE family outer membrane protein [Dysgonomonas sp. Marseille-P4677]|uniref:SusE domain-containing protein n=1 Tax=Dysgonomonas sp. Marseille-P4677 TaxID=2364790 RepID=UPI0019146F02|nr:SusF/SusE family outer membrane protein [Dysgonomonas sp. Marseille-P4677]MBK5722408.1 SusF/SusE family outer membrane protein [Dysgonomonas sp. Marseille-P4677]